MKMMSKTHHLRILIITTKGCIACDILKRNLINAIQDNDYDVDVKTEDFSEVDKSVITKNNITDFPTMLIYDNGKVVFTCVGSAPERELVNIIKKLL